MLDTSIEICYWVYILQKGTKPEYRIGYATDLSPITDESNLHGVKLVYTRRFQHPLEALGHKLLLENVSKASLERIIDSIES